jgi:hypothetical protein
MYRSVLSACRNLNLAAGFVFLLLATSVAMATGKAVDDLGKPRPSADRTWTIVMYFCADNNLEAELLTDLNEFEKALPDKGVEAIVLVDRAKGFTAEDGDWTGGRVYRLRPDKDLQKLNSELLADCGEVNMGDAATLSKFVGAALKAFPAKHYAMLMSDHGAGWPDNCNDSGAPGAKDDYDELTLPETVSGLAKGLKAAGVAKFDLLTFDMCLMGQVEVAVACREVAGVMLALESLGPGRGLPLEEVLGEFATQSDVRKLAASIVERFGEGCKRHGDERRQLSAVDLGKVLAVRDALNAVAAKLVASAPDQWATYSRSLFFSETYNGRVEYRRGPHAKACFDMIDILRRCQANSKAFPAEGELETLKAAVKQCLIASYRGAARKLSSGLSLYAPVRAENMRPTYAAQAGTKDWAWREFLEKLHALQKAHGKRPKVTKGEVFGPDGKPAKAIVPLTGGYCTFDLEGTNVLWLTLDFCARTKDGSYAVLFKTFHVAPGLGRRKEETAPALIDLLVPVYPDGKTQLGQELGGIQFALWVDGKVVPATVEVIDPERPDVATVYAELVDGAGEGKNAPIEIQFNTDNWKVRSIIGHFPRPGGGYSTSNITLKPAAKIVPLLETETADGKVRNIGMPELRWGQGPELIMRLAPAGEHILSIKAEAISGLSSYATIPYRVEPNKRLDDYMKGTDKLTAARLHGQWVLQDLGADPKTKALAFSAAGVTIDLKANPKDAETMLYSAVIEGEKIEGVARFDTRGVPMLSFFVRNDDGRLVRVKAYVALAEKSNGCPVVILKNLGIEEDAADIQRMVRPGDVDKVENAFGKGSGDDDKGDVLVGTWKNADGVVLKCDKTRYVMYVDGELDDRGSYQIVGTKIRIVTMDGEKETVRFTLVGKTLTIVDSDGVKTVLQRAD